MRQKIRVCKGNMREEIGKVKAWEFNRRVGTEILTVKEASYNWNDITVRWLFIIRNKTQFIESTHQKMGWELYFCSVINLLWDKSMTVFCCHSPLYLLLTIFSNTRRPFEFKKISNLHVLPLVVAFVSVNCLTTYRHSPTYAISNNAIKKNKIWRNRKDSRIFPCGNESATRRR
jgi:hypothetical protein